MEVYRYDRKSYKVQYQTQAYEDTSIITGRDITQVINQLLAYLKVYGDTLIKIIKMEEM